MDHEPDQDAGADLSVAIETPAFSHPCISNPFPPIFKLRNIAERAVAYRGISISQDYNFSIC
jgi:hypothetical protein